MNVLLPQWSPPTYDIDDLNDSEEADDYNRRSELEQVSNPTGENSNYCIV